MVRYCNIREYFFTIYIHFIGLNWGSLIKINVKVTYGEKLQFHRYHNTSKIMWKTQILPILWYLESMIKTLKSLPQGHC